MAPNLLVLGSVALDTLETERGIVYDSLGGSATHASLAAGYFTRPRLVGVVGEDFPPRYLQFLQERVDTSELKVLPGKTFRWHGVHSLTTGRTESKRTELHTYEQFDPVLSQESARAPYVLLGNISPELQLKVLNQLQGPRLVAVDTMSLWIATQPDMLREVMRRADIFLLNQQEAAEMIGEASDEGWTESDAIEAGRKLRQQGAKTLIIKRGAEPALLLSEDAAHFVSSCEDVDVMDPTGAGDNFAGAMMGYLAARDAGANSEDLIPAMQCGASVAAYGIELFGTLAHRYLKTEDVLRRRPGVWERVQPLRDQRGA